MKARDYLDRWIAAGGREGGHERERTIEIAIDMVCELRAIVTERHAASAEAHLGIYRELKKKWEAFYKLLRNRVSESEYILYDDLFDRAVATVLPIAGPKLQTLDKLDRMERKGRREATCQR